METQDHIVAGLDTSILTLAAFAWLLSLQNNRIWQERYSAKARRSSDAARVGGSEKAPTHTPFIKEALRRYLPVLESSHA